MRSVERRGGSRSLGSRWASFSPSPTACCRRPCPRCSRGCWCSAFWKVATGAIHLDGLADCLDGLGGRDREHRLAIMHDSRIGVFGAVGLMFYLLIAVVALAEIPTGARGCILLMAPVVGRLAPLVIAPRFSPANPDHGPGAAFVRALSPWAGLVHLVAIAVFSAWLLGPLGPGHRRSRRSWPSSSGRHFSSGGSAAPRAMSWARPSS